MNAAVTRTSGRWRALHETTRISLEPAGRATARAPQRLLRYDGERLTNVGLGVSVDDVLRASMGISGWEQRGALVEPLFVVPSSGNLRTVEAYVVIARAGATSIAHYDPVNDSLNEAGCVSGAAPAGALVVLRAHVDRQVQRYGPRGERYALLDLGHAAGAVALAAEALTIECTGIASRADFSALMSPVDGLGEAATIGLVVGCDAPAAWERWLRAVPRAQRRSRARLEPTGRVQATDEIAATNDATDVLIRRRSSRAFTGEGVDARFVTMVGNVGRTGPEHGALRRYVVANDIGTRGAAIFELAASGSLVSRAPWDRDETACVCGYQSIASDAAAVFILAGEWFGDDASYEAMHTTAGMTAQRMSIAAARCGLGARPLGGFFDDEIARAIRLPDALVLEALSIGPSG